METIKTSFSFCLQHKKIIVVLSNFLQFFCTGSPKIESFVSSSVLWPVSLFYDTGWLGFVINYIKYDSGVKKVKDPK